MVDREKEAEDAMDGDARSSSSWRKSNDRRRCDLEYVCVAVCMRDGVETGRRVGVETVMRVGVEAAPAHTCPCRPQRSESRAPGDWGDLVVSMCAAAIFASPPSLPPRNLTFSSPSSPSTSSSSTNESAQQRTAAAPGARHQLKSMGLTGVSGAAGHRRVRRQSCQGGGSANTIVDVTSSRSIACSAGSSEPL